MSALMYKNGNSRMVRGMDAKDFLNDGWTFEPSIRPRKRRTTLQVSVDETKPIIQSPDNHNNNEEINNGD